MGTVTGAFLLLALLTPPSTGVVIYVTPTPPVPCPGQPCYNLSYYAKEAAKYLKSNTTMLFLPGEHNFKVQINITNVENFSMISENGTSMVICQQSDCNGFHFENVQHLYISSLIFFSDGHSITAIQVYNFVLENCTLANNGDIALIAHESALFLEGNTFVNNSVQDKVPTLPYPGGAVSIFSSNMSLQGLNYFFNNTCFGGHCGGSAIYATDSLIIVEGNVSIVNNSVVNTLDAGDPSGGGGVLFVGSGVYIAGHMTFINNSVNTTYIKDNTCEVAGGGALIVGGATIISGKITFVNGVANGESGCGGGLGLILCSVTIAGDIEFRQNRAGYYGGGIYANAKARIVLVGSLSLTENSANRGGGLAMLGGGIDINGSMLFINNYAGYDGGGMDIEEGILNVTGNLSLRGNSAAFGGGINILNTNVDVSSTGVISLTDNHGASDDSNQKGQGGGWNMQTSTVKIAGILLLHANTAEVSGGGIAITGNSVFLSGNLTITDNVANETAGGILIAESNVTLFNALVSGNTAIEGGGLGVQSSNVIISDMVTIASNSAEYNGGGATIVSSKLTINGTLEAIGNSAITFGAGIVAQDCKIVITGHTLVADNYANFVEDADGGGMVLRLNSIITVIGTLLLSNNSATHSGGGMYFNETSSLAIAGKVCFTANSAGLGGAIFVADTTRLVYCSAQISGANCVIENCFFRNVSDNTNILMVFDGNMAESGSVLFGGSVDRCTLYDQPGTYSGDVFDAISDYSKQPATNSLISSYPYRVCLCKNGKPQCGEVSDITAYPGETFHFQAVTVGQRNGTVIKMVINAITKANPSYKARLGVFEDRQEAIDCTELKYTIFSDLPYVKLEMYVYGSCSSLDGSENRLDIPVKMKQCPIGFKLSEEPWHCICEERLQKYTNSCDINGQRILRDGSFWVGYNYDNKSQGLILHPHCPSGYCTTKAINFTLDDIDLQCAPNRTGLLCGACDPGLSLAIGNLKCLPCSDAYLALIIPFAVMGLALMLFLLIFLVFTVKAGMIGGLVFYTSIVGANQNIFFSPGTKNFLITSVSWFRLDLGIETCFYDGMDIYAKTWLQFVFPIYIFGLISILIIFYKYYPSIPQKLYRIITEDNSDDYNKHPKAVLATFFVLSYGKIVHTCISVFSYTTLEYPNNKTELVWLYDANIKYLQGKHIPLFLVSVLFSAFVILPFTFLLLLYQLFELIPWMKSPLSTLEVFHDPYNRKHRYWPGLLLLIRLALFVIFGINALRDYSENLLAISVATFAILMWPWIIRDQVYHKSKEWFGVVESSYILNLGLFAGATFYVQQSGGNQAVVANISTGVAFATFVVTFLYYVYQQRKKITSLIKKVWEYLKTRCNPKYRALDESTSLINSTKVIETNKTAD